jgi:tRNA threonylcarbamoyladenosine biosynthesis protein TsaB
VALEPALPELSDRPHSLGSVLLAFDTATPAVTVALADGAEVLAQATTLDARRHGELLAPAIEQVLHEAAVDRAALTAVAVGVGPGPFTGLRVGLVTATTLGAVLGIPVLGVCTLDAVALGSGLQGSFRVATDARRKEVYWAEYDGVRRTDGPHVDRPADVAWDGPVVGEGARLWPESFPDARDPAHPEAADLARWVAAGLPTLEPRPLYLRRPDAVEPGTRKRVGT